VKHRHPQNRAERRAAYERTRGRVIRMLKIWDPWAWQWPWTNRKASWQDPRLVGIHTATHHPRWNRERDDGTPYSDLRRELAPEVPSREPRRRSRRRKRYGLRLYWATTSAGRTILFGGRLWWGPWYETERARDDAERYYRSCREWFGDGPRFSKIERVER
jgi:hypothetical protein